MGGGKKGIHLPLDAILTDYYLYPKLWEDFVKYKLNRVSLDDNIFTKVGVSISDIMAISYLKVKASLNPSGLANGWQKR